MEQTQEQIKLDNDKRTIEEFLANPDNKKMAIELAHQIEKEMGGDWFKADKLMRKFKLSQQEAATRFMTLGAFNLAAYKEEKGIQWYKIDLDHKIQRQLILQQIDFHNGQVLILKEKLVKLG
jgi:hypothetical protein